MSEKNENYRSLTIMPRKWGLLPTIDMYVMREFVTKLSVLLLVFIILFVLSDVFNNLGSFLEKKASLLTFFHFLFLRLPGNIRFVMPIAVLLGCMWTMATFGKNQEVTAMRASGVSLFRCGGAILVIGFLFSLVNVYFNESLVPAMERKAQALKNRALDDVEEQFLLSYRSPNGSRNWFFHKFISGSDNEGILMKNYRQDKSLEWDITAERVSYANKKGWTFYNVVKTAYSRDGLMPKEPQKITELTIPISEISETPADILNAIKDEEELPTWVIWGIVSRNPDMSDNVRSIYMTVFYYRLAFPWACFLACFLGIPLATRNERSGSLLAIILAVVIIVVYIVMAQIFLVMGKRGILPSSIAGLAPTLAFITYGYCKVFFNKA